MARNFRRQRSAHPIAELNITNLVDLGFILLVIFMIATPLIQNEQTLPMNLPKVGAVPQPPVDSKEKFAIVGVDASGRFIAGEKSEQVTLSELQNRLRAYAKEEKPPVMRIRGDKTVQYDKVMQVMAEVMKAGLTRVTFDGLKED
ncbi:MAG: biopolymer transporter ExbD [Verrucomicrobiota bacterium]